MLVYPKHEHDFMVEFNESDFFPKQSRVGLFNT